MLPLIDAINDARETPCERFSCPNRAKCGSDELSCDSFRHYVRSGYAAHPQITHNFGIGPRKDNGEMKGYIEATRDKYLQMMRDCV